VIIIIAVEINLAGLKYDTMSQEANTAPQIYISMYTSQYYEWTAS